MINLTKARFCWKFIIRYDEGTIMERVGHEEPVVKDFNACQNKSSQLKFFGPNLVGSSFH
ncbi:hypothetical protein Hanom_Chr06g00481101 [Helianthus anomalus]